ncbi:hypothetical protein BJ138DRAFT_1235222 [Hygrophoropsis aurantiaca]|uniref:Uncharacterized protein n=1 Tax=Hygrophoropsis aurantiaca TaxID=72124 RepID=A0ACB7ZV61_9AGAM|nr:hypothetical protein BJ138DRAFT_1235222 [Hygrophoropsis aurantiaca]
MSEYWVSHKKYFCKYCDIYISDDAPSRRQHENGLRHKGNVERFVRGLYKAGEKRKKDQEEEKREMQRIGKAAEAAYAQDVGAGLVKPSGSGSAPVASTSKAAPKSQPKPSNPYANYTTAASLGYTDPDAERIKAETERRQTQGVAGNWEVVESSASTSREESAQPSEQALDETNRKREAPPDEEDERRFKLRKKTVGVGLGEIYDPGIIPIKLKTKKEEPTEDTKLSTPSAQLADPIVSSDPIATGVPKWTKIQWKKVDSTEKVDESGDLSGGNVDDGKPNDQRDDPVTRVHKEPPALPKIEVPDQDSARDLLSDPVKQEDISVSAEIPAPPNLFRKRKIASNAGGRVRRPV